MTIHRLLVPALILSLAMTSSRDAAAKAECWKSYVTNVPAKVAGAYFALDGDTNFVLVPSDDVSEREQFFSTFWTDYAEAAEWREFVTDLLRGVLYFVELWEEPGNDEDEARGYAKCGQCLAGAGRCVTSSVAFDFDRTECKQLLGCAACLYALAGFDAGNPGGAENVEMATFTAVAEVEMPDAFEANFNVKSLLHLGPSGSADWCNVVDNPNWICGKKVYLSGVLNMDQTHYNKPEIHPIHAMLIEEMNQRNSSHVRKRYHLAGFVDDSGEGDYRELEAPIFPNKNTVKFDLPLYQGEPPPSEGGPGERWVPYCNVKHEHGTNLKTPPKQITQSYGRCPTLRIELNSTAKHGAAWAGSVDMGWRKQFYKLSMLRYKEAPFKGVFDRRPPGTSFPLGKLRRWHKWKVVTTSFFSPDLQVDWSWVNGSGEQGRVYFVPIPGPGRIPNFYAWVGVSRGESYVVRPRLQVRAPRTNRTCPSRMSPDRCLEWLKQKETLVDEMLELRAPQPLVRAWTYGEKVLRGRKGNRYTAKLQAVPVDFLVPKSKIRWSVRDDRGRRLGRSVQFPLEVTLGYGESALWEISAEDDRGVERARVERFFIAPRLFVEVQKQLVNRAPAPKPYRLFTGLPGRYVQSPGGAHLQTYGEVRLIGVPKEKTTDKFPGAKIKGPVKYTWKDIKYRARASNWITKNVPAHQYSLGKTHRTNDTLIIRLPRAIGSYEYQASVTVKDGWGHEATEHVVGVNGHLSSKNQDYKRLIDQIERLLSTKHRFSRVRIPGFGPLDPVRRQLDALRGRASRVRGNTREASFLLADIESLTRAVHRRYAQKRRLRFRDRARARFTTKRTRLITREVRSRLLRARLRRHPALLRQASKFRSLRSLLGRSGRVPRRTRRRTPARRSLRRTPRR